MISNEIKYGLIAVLSVVVVLVAGIAATAYTAQTRSYLMAKDIQIALEKGVNPIVIRCAYADEADRICLVYAATRGDEKRVDMLNKTAK